MYLFLSLLQLKLVNSAMPPTYITLSELEKQAPLIGYYKVGQHKFIHKLDAGVMSKHTKQPVEWYFHHEVFKNIDWTQVPEQGLSELYKLRAQQLRERYDYICVRYSGGWDSFTAIDSFLSNGIHLDEIVFHFPMEMYQQANYEVNTLDRSPGNWLSEYELVVRPNLNYWKLNYPKTKITIYDYSHDYKESIRDDDFPVRFSGTFTPGKGLCHANYERSAEYLNRADKVNRVAQIYGIDKPKIKKEGSDYYLYFLDMTVQLCGRRYNEITSDNTDVVPFYWGSDYTCINILRKQCSIIKNWSRLNPDKDWLFHYLKPEQVTLYHEAMKPLIYPKYKPDSFQTNKPTSWFFLENDRITFNTLAKERPMQVYVSGIKQIQNMVDNDLIIYNENTNLPRMLKPMASPRYKI
mgnify:FL=1